MKLSRARSIAIKYYALLFAVLFLSVYLFYVLPTIIFDIFSDYFILALPYLILLVFLWSKYISTLPSKMVTLPILCNDLDAPLFYEIANRTNPRLHLMAEYHIGNYQEVISFCNQALSNHKTPRKNRYVLWYYLAIIYFDIGDDEKLKKICDEIQRNLKFEKKPDKIIARYPRINFFIGYLDQNYDDCLDRTRKTSKDKLSEISQTYRTARIALAKGEKDEARRLFEDVINKAPKLNLAILASHGIEAIDKGINYRDTFESLNLNPDYIPSAPKKNQKVIYILTYLCVCIVVFVAAYFTIQAKDNHDLAKYNEELQMLVAEDYTDVEILNTFEIEKDGQIINTMFFAQTKDKLILGTTFIYQNESGYYIDQEIPLGDLESNEDPFSHLEFATLISGYYVDGYLYKNKENITQGYSQIFEIIVNGEKIYFVVTEISETNNQNSFGGSLGIQKGNII